MSILQQESILTDNYKSFGAGTTPKEDDMFQNTNVRYETFKSCNDGEDANRRFSLQRPPIETVFVCNDLEQKHKYTLPQISERPSEYT